VEHALANLRAAELLSVDGIRTVNLRRLERLIRPSGYFRQKARRLKTFVAFLDREYDGSLEQLLAQPTEKLREELLNLNGVGPETADSILLYAGNHPVFVVDAYTRRIIERHGIMSGNSDYEDIRVFFERSLASLANEPEQSERFGFQSEGLEFRGAFHPPSAMSTAPRSPLAQVYNEMHGLIVGIGKHYCGKSQPKCDGCPLQPFLPRGK
jgi:endonuclease-3 related protein